MTASTLETLTEGDLSILTDGELVAERAREAAGAASPTFRNRVLTYGPAAAILVLRSFDDFLGLLDLIDRGIVEIVQCMNEE